MDQRSTIVYHSLLPACLIVGQGLCSHYSEERKLPQWFELSSYITLEPNSYSKRILSPRVLLSYPPVILKG